MRYKRIKYRDRNAELRKLGCKMPESTEYYSYNAIGRIRSQPCVGLYTSLKPSVTKYDSVQHFSIGKACHEAVEVLCVRYTPDVEDVIITRHYIGECPLCVYHTQEEYHATI
jgi:hypothetical protein